ncbi:25S rRNA (cytosine(2870)-C(5))-methyltransferase-like [Homarus americanus]|uniref:25S rRNA (cytosine(2870)-C(5))-methyltransferase-like n=1 Tax=Homarus americanus TaxID=6706 RepID=UPI001C496594|nr:25S rRNA (cytosine(2870)-C(5))-methyltransferase-like [Homarus americanus]
MALEFEKAPQPIVKEDESTTRISQEPRMFQPTTEAQYRPTQSYDPLEIDKILTQSDLKSHVMDLQSELVKEILKLVDGSDDSHVSNDSQKKDIKPSNSLEKAHQEDIEAREEARQARKKAKRARKKAKRARKEAKRAREEAKRVRKEAKQTDKDKQTHKEDKQTHKEDKQTCIEDKQTHKEDKQTCKEDKQEHKEANQARKEAKRAGNEAKQKCKEDKQEHKETNQARKEAKRAGNEAKQKCKEDKQEHKEANQARKEANQARKEARQARKKAKLAREEAKWAREAKQTDKDKQTHKEDKQTCKEDKQEHKEAKQEHKEAKQEHKEAKQTGKPREHSRCTLQSKLLNSLLKKAGLTNEELRALASEKKMYLKKQVTRKLVRFLIGVYYYNVRQRYFKKKIRFRWFRELMFNNRLQQNIDWCDWITAARSSAWSHLVRTYNWKKYVEYTKTNPDPRIPEFDGDRRLTQPRLPSPDDTAPPERPIYCMYYGCQGASGMLPVLALAPEKGSSVLDLCAAAGHNTILAGMFTKRQGMVVSNVLVMQDEAVIQNNIHRHCFLNAIVVRIDLQQLPQGMRESFGYALVDAPSSGTGCVRSFERDDWPQNDIEQVDVCVKLQKVLILDAIDALQVGGYLVYSTTSVLVEENEAVVSYALSERNVMLVPIDLPFGKAGLVTHQDYRFRESMKSCRRIYSFRHNIQGIFLAKMRKLSPGESH